MYVYLSHVCIYVCMYVCQGWQDSDTTVFTTGKNLVKTVLSKTSFWTLVGKTGKNLLNLSDVLNLGKTSCILQMSYIFDF